MQSKLSELSGQTDRQNFCVWLFQFFRFESSKSKQVDKSGHENSWPGIEDGVTCCLTRVLQMSSSLFVKRTFIFYNPWPLQSSTFNKRRPCFAILHATQPSLTWQQNVRFGLYTVKSSQGLLDSNERLFQMTNLKAAARSFVRCFHIHRFNIFRQMRKWANIWRRRNESWDGFRLVMDGWLDG